MRRKATLYLDDRLRRSVAQGRHNFIGHLIGTLDQGGFEVAFAPESRIMSDRRTLGITHMAPPPPGGLTFRRVYHYPFWAIETTAERWEWEVAKAPFSHDLVSKDEAERLFERWQARLFSDSARNTSREGFVYVPLQGRLLQHRSFQSCAPLEMLFLTLRAEPEREVIATLHPRESYSEAEREALAALADKNPRLSIRTGGMEDLLQRCDYVVTMNSSAAFNGYFFRKPCILFGRIDFHHIALTATPQDLSAFGRIADHVPDYAAYLMWFWQHRSINAGRPDVREKIRAALIRGGWPL